MPVIQTRPFDPEDHEDPVQGLTLAIRGLRLGERVRMPDGTLVVSQSVPVGAHHQRRFTIVPSEQTSTPAERHRAFTLGHNAHKTAEAAARRILNPKKSQGEQ